MSPERLDQLVQIAIRHLREATPEAVAVFAPIASAHEVRAAAERLVTEGRARRTDHGFTTEDNA